MAVAVEGEEIAEAIESASALIDEGAAAFGEDLSLGLEEASSAGSEAETLRLAGEDSVEEVTELVRTDVVADVMPAEDSEPIAEAQKTMVQKLNAAIDKEAEETEALGGEASAESAFSKSTGKVASAQFEAQGAKLAATSEPAGASEEVAKASRLKTIGKIALYTVGTAFALDWIGSKLGDIISVGLHADDAPEWAQNMTDDQKADLEAVSAALPKLTVLIQGWQQQWETYQTNYVDLGTVSATFSSTTQDVPVMYILFYAFEDMSNVVTNTQTIFSGDTSTLSTADMIVATNNIFIVLADALSMYTLKDKSQHMQLEDFPPTKDNETITALILTFKNGPNKVADVGVKYTRFATENAITSYLQVKIIQEVYRQLQDVVLPQMQAAAQTEFKSKAKDYMNSEEGDIIGLSLIPGAGPELARNKLEEVQKEASKRGTDAAQKAAEEVLAKLQPEVSQKAKDAVQQYADENQDQLKKIAELAMQDALGDVTAKLDE